jgi:hypothetical protein
VEILSMIVSFIPGMTIPYRNETVPCMISDRYKTLLTLSLTCRWIRAAVTPLVWRSLEVHHDPGASITSANVNGMWNMTLWDRYPPQNLCRRLKSSQSGNPSMLPLFGIGTVLGICPHQLNSSPV